MHRMGDRMTNMACIRSLWCHDVGSLPLTMASRHDGVSGAHRGRVAGKSAATGKSDAALSVAPPGLEPGFSCSRGADVTLQIPATCHHLREFVSPDAGV